MKIQQKNLSINEENPPIRRRTFIRTEQTKNN